MSDIFVPPYFFYVYFFVLGAIFASFINVLALRMHTGRSIGGRSKCMSCGHTLSAFQLIPIVSFLIQRGKCVWCGTRLPMRYLFVEILLGCIFSFAAFVFSDNLIVTFCVCILSGIGLWISLYDYDHKVIPFSLNWMFAVAAILFSIYTSLFALTPIPIMHHLLGGIMLFGVGYALWFFSRGRVLGFADTILFFSIGFLFGPIYGLFSIWLACVLGSFYGAWLYTKKAFHRWGNSQNHGTIQSEVPFGPFLLIASYITLICIEWYGFFIATLL
jgi:prepilin signal peptidase PulO-like enzyme (type II secretory pathway)